MRGELKPSTIKGDRDAVVRYSHASYRHVNKPPIRRSPQGPRRILYRLYRSVHSMRNHQSLVSKAHGCWSWPRRLLFLGGRGMRHARRLLTQDPTDEVLNVDHRNRLVLCARHIWYDWSALEELYSAQLLRHFGSIQSRSRNPLGRAHP